MIQKPNLLPPAYQPPPPVNWLRVGIISAVFAVIVTFGVIGTKFYLEVQSLEGKITELQRLAEQSTVLEEVARINSLQDEINSLEEEMAAMKTRIVPLSVIFGDISRVMPTRMSLVTADCAGDVLIIQGVADTRRPVANYVIELRKFNWIDKAEVLSIIENADGDGNINYSFEIMVNLKQLVVEGGQTDA